PAVADGGGAVGEKARTPAEAGVRASLRPLRLLPRRRRRPRRAAAAGGRAGVLVLAARAGRGVGVGAAGAGARRRAARPGVGRDLGLLVDAPRLDGAPGAAGRRTDREPERAAGERTDDGARSGAARGPLLRVAAAGREEAQGDDAQRSHTHDALTMVEFATI